MPRYSIQWPRHARSLPHGAIMSALLDALEWAGESLDKPGRAVRGALGGQGLGALKNLIPFSDTAGWTDPSQSVSGRGLLEKYGMLSPAGEDDGFGLGDIAGTVVEMALDPTNLIGGGALKKLIGVRRGAKAANARREMLLAGGAMPEEIARLTKVVDEFGNPVATYHGTPHAYDKPDWSKMDPEGLFGPEYYSTVSPEMANKYPLKDAAYRQSPESDFVIGQRMDEIQRILQQNRGALSPIEASKLAREYEDIDDLRRAGISIGRMASYSPERISPAAESLNYSFNKLFPQSGAQFVVEPPLNIRKQFLDIRNPFDIERTFPSEEVVDLYDRILGRGPSYGIGDMSGGEIYDKLVRGFRDASFPSGGIFANIPDTIAPKAGANELLKNLGYDAIKHMGGGLMGDVPHQVYIAFDPKQIHQPLVVGGPQRIPSMSPLLAALGAHNVGARSY